MALLDIWDMLQSMGKDISSFLVPKIEESFDTTICQRREIVEESMIEFDPEHVHLTCSLNPE
jgi:ATP-dependent DNA helicase PIF1